MVRTNRPAAAGWYSDGQQPGLRWWDGTQWTEHRAPVPAVPAAPVAIQGNTAPIPKRPMSGSMKFLIATPFLILVAGFLGYLNSNAAADPDRNNNDITAVYACEKAVAENLKAPATAKFSSQAGGGNPIWTVTGYVDAENSFGALIRSAYACEVTITGGSSHTTITRLDG
jgi:hypothetical protein